MIAQKVDCQIVWTKFNKKITNKIKFGGERQTGKIQKDFRHVSVYSCLKFPASNYNRQYLYCS